MVEQTNEELLAALGVEVQAEKKAKRTPKQERIIAGFEEIQRFVDEHGRRPLHGENNDIFERLYATRLDQIRRQAECFELVEALDHQGLLSETRELKEPQKDYANDEELLADLGVVVAKEGSLTDLKHVKSSVEKKRERELAEEIGNRTKCEDFEVFKSLFDDVQHGLESGLLEAKVLKDQKDLDYMAKVSQGDWFIVNGLKAYVAELSDTRKHGFDKNDFRLRVIYDNKTESDLLLRSMQKALYEDSSSRRIVSLSAGPLFSGSVTEDDTESGTVYVLRSQSTHELIDQNRQIIHKIGVTGGTVEKRIANAKLDPTFLMADVEIVASYELFNINRSKLENVLHRFFEDARLDIDIPDRFGNKVKPKEWFLVPLFVIDQAMDLLKAGELPKYRYDHEQADLVKL